jgi:SAM-dependent methyltransferase
MSSLKFPILAPGINSTATLFANGYMRTILGQMTYGRVLNLGAGAASTIFRYSDILQNSEYHTLEFSGETNPTYVGDIQSMPQIESDSYDWVISIAVLEHVKDMRAAASEIARITKPGGWIYIVIPTHNEQHWGFGYSDYWRTTAHGIRELFEKDFGVKEIGYWGDSVVDPFSVSLIAQKGAPRTEGEGRFYQIDGGHDKTTAYIDGAQYFNETMNVWRLTVSVTQYVNEVARWRAEMFRISNGSNMTIRDADSMIKKRLAEHLGHISITNEAAEWVSARK